ncbi:unnamed protein product [Blepharisma stoltei]|uniref:J domain-containing protein n=1 Tax=Blepharisma stoltei TaxID=1481888 RepID=A0AAU9JEP9_9CILI|nr:unnamed protein product [Blepharisma stoltei]
MEVETLALLIGVGFAAEKLVIKNEKVKNKTAIVGAITILALAIVMGIYFKNKPPNVYQELGISRTASIEEIKELYKAVVKKTHPDKNPSPSAHQDFIDIQSKYEYIKSEDARLRYELYLNTKELHNIAFKTGIFYIYWLILSMAISRSKNDLAGSYSGIILALFGIYEFKVRVQKQFIIFLNFIPLTVAEQMDLFKVSFSCIALGLLMWNSLKIQEVKTKKRQEINELAKNEEITTKLKKFYEKNLNSEGEIGNMMKEITKEFDEWKKKKQSMWKKWLEEIIMMVLIARFLKYQFVEEEQSE